MDPYNKAANFSLFTEAKAADGAFASNTAQDISLQDAILLEPYTTPQIVKFRPHTNGYFQTANDYMTKAMSYPNPDDNLTHNRYSDGTVIPYQLMSMGNIRAGAGLDRVHAVSIGETELQFHNFQDLHYDKDNKTGQ